MRTILCIFAITLLLCSCESPTERRLDYEVQGVDVSRYQADVNWDLVAQDDIHFAFVKVSEGQDLVDNRFCYNWDEIHRVGIKRGAYHFFRPTVSPLKQARLYTNFVELEDGDLPPVLDIEVTDGVTKKELVHRVQLWVGIIERHYNIRPIIYTNLKFYNKYLADDFENYPLWIARYSTKNPVPNTKRAWQFWQYGNRGQINGIEGNVDLNVFNGTQLELEALCYAPGVTFIEK